MRALSFLLTIFAIFAIADSANAVPSYPPGALVLERELLAQQTADAKSWIKNEGEDEATGQFLTDETPRNAARKYGVSGSDVSTMAFLILMEAARVADTNVENLVNNVQGANASRMDLRQQTMTSNGIAFARQAQMSGGLQSAQQNGPHRFVPLASTDPGNPIANARAASAVIPPPSMTLQDAMDRESQVEDLLAGAMKHVSQPS